VATGDPATQLKSALDAVKTRLRNQINDLNFQIRTGKKIIRSKTEVPTDIESRTLTQERNDLKAQFDEIFGKSEKTDAQRVALAMKAVERSITDLETQLRPAIFPRANQRRQPRRNWKQPAPNVMRSKSSCRNCAMPMQLYKSNTRSKAWNLPSLNTSGELTKVI
jgi:hypothetical protein